MRGVEEAGKKDKRSRRIERKRKGRHTVERLASHISTPRPSQVRHKRFRSLIPLLLLPRLRQHLLHLFLSSLCQVDSPFRASDDLPVELRVDYLDIVDVRLFDHGFQVLGNGRGDVGGGVGGEQFCYYAGGKSGHLDGDKSGHIGCSDWVNFQDHLEEAACVDSKIGNVVGERFYVRNDVMF